MRQMQNIQNLNVLQSFVSLCGACHGQEVSYAASSRKLGISQPTVEEWISLTSSFVTLLQKPYFMDSTIAAYLTRRLQQMLLSRDS